MKNYHIEVLSWKAYWRDSALLPNSQKDWVWIRIHKKDQLAKEFRKKEGTEENGVDGTGRREK